MATGLNKDVIIYNELAQTAYLERIQDNLNVFNAASNGCILLQDENIQGDFRKQSFYKIGGSLEHRDINSNGAVENKTIAMGEMVGVKIPFKYGPYAITEEAMKRRARSTEEFSILIGQDYADALLDGYFKYLTAGAMAAIGTNAEMKASASIATDHKKVLTKGMRKFGDKFGRIGLWVMDSAVYFDLIDDAITNKVFESEDQIIYGGLPATMGKPVLVTDKAKANTILGLQAGAITITNSQLPGFRAYDINSEENLAIGIRAEGTFNLDVLGYSYKESAGANPNLSTIGTGASWQKYATSNKNTAGVLIELS
ncbi:major capsid protein [Glaesserella parasuis]|uniref:major capsid protein n=1 Tax=Glaesserella parasuis TaxID=738 RepID=UPI002436D01C|nr:major capsid protein [Glaesserella parasuis]MDG6831192.1 major capsid protein [Glaesserella parasuis]MDG6852863.1 major capsid protein [Glaesserella parasuis]